MRPPPPQKNPQAISKQNEFQTKTEPTRDELGRLPQHAQLNSAGGTQHAPCTTCTDAVPSPNHAHLDSTQNNANSADPPTRAAPTPKAFMIPRGPYAQGRVAAS